MRRFAYLALRPPLEVLTILLLVSCTSGARGRAAQTSQTSADSGSDSTGGLAFYGGFILVHDKDAMTDQDQSFITESDADSSAMLTWQCRGRETQLFVKTEDFLDNDLVSVMWRLDSAEAQGPEFWSASTTGTGLFAPDSVMVPLTDGALKAQTLRVRAVDFQGTPHEYEFPLGGLGAALHGLPCGLAAARKRLAAEQRERKKFADSVRLARKRAADFPKEWPWVGYAGTKEYMPTTSPCWREFTDSATSIFFKTEAAAKAKGYTKSTFCR